MIEILTFILQAIIAIAVPVLITVGSNLGKYYIDLKIQQIENEKVKNALSNVSNIVFDSVHYVNQTYVEGLKAEGKFDKEAQQHALLLAKSRAIDLMNEQTKRILTIEYEDVDKYITTIIESIIAQQKTNK